MAASSSLQSSLKNIRSSYQTNLEDEPKLKQQHGLYGDIVVAFCMLFATPAMAYRMFREGGLENFDAGVMVGAIGLATIFHYLAWKHNNVNCSRVAFLLNCFSGIFMEWKEWPLKGVCTVTQRFQTGVVCLCLSNISLTAYEQTIRLLSLFVIGSYVSITSPYSVYTEDALPGIGIPVLIGLIVVYLYHNSDNIGKNLDVAQVRLSEGIFNIQIQKDEFMVQTARLALAAIYGYITFHTLRETISQEASAKDIVAGFWHLFKATMIASIGSIATGVFKTTINQKEELEIIVRERTKEIRLKNIQLRRINIAFEASETAIAITDASRTVIWTNQAFESLSRKTRGDNDMGWSSIDQQLTDAIVLDGKTNETKLRGAFDFSAPRQDEIEIQENGQEGKHSTKSQYRLEVTPFSDHDDLDNKDESESRPLAVDGERKGGENGRRDSFQAKNGHKLFLVAFNDITANRAREEAEQNAREEALLSKAMKDSMVTLTHELRTPLQGIMGITSLMLEQKDSERDSELVTKESFVQDNSESLGLIMASSSLLLNLINNLLDVKKATANSKWNRRVGMPANRKICVRCLIDPLYFQT